MSRARSKLREEAEKEHEIELEEQQSEELTQALIKIHEHCPDEIDKLLIDLKKETDCDDEFVAYLKRLPFSLQYYPVN